MISTNSLSMTDAQYQRMYQHLFPGDGLEAAAVLVCSRVPQPRLRLLVKDVVLVPYDECTVRERDQIVWPGGAIEEAIDLAEEDGLSLVLVHSHPGGLFAFSAQDDRSDRAVIPGIFQSHGSMHGSGIVTPDGAMLARVYRRDMSSEVLDVVSVAGDDIRWWWRDRRFMQRPLAFTSETREELSRLVACVVGVSGTGSLVAEQLARLGFGRVQLIDFDHVEARNLNRIINATRSDAANARMKVDVFADAIAGHRGDHVAVPLASSINDRSAVLLASQADVMFCCVDTVEARYICDLIAATFLMPLFDVGVAIPTRRLGETVAIADVCGRVDYVQPGGCSLQDRGVYSPETLRAEYLSRVSPASHQEEMRAGYLKGVIEQTPSVITLNMRAASACVMEFIARVYPFRHTPNSHHARTAFSLADAEDESFAEASFPCTVNRNLARGDREPLLGLPALRYKAAEVDRAA
ncbi:ThiF family adenylyltransferase [Paraburkholderia graminis]|uniref:ThiF family adenylyltransferase n=1 Tax=Paraburkholderia graminis TaxID=60548 RepID=UPI0038B6BE4D